jgi:hypothetical protein
MLGPIAASPRARVAIFAGGLLTLLTLVLLLSDGGILITRPFWVDEVLTVLVAGRSSPIEVLADLGHGADGGASLFHLSMWLLDKLTGGLTPTAVRMLSLLCIVGALIVVFALLARRFSGTASAAGTLAVGANALVIEHSYEGRFYGPWLLCLALVAWALGRRQETPTRRNAIALAVIAFALCTIHFYGIVTLAIMIVAVIVSRGSRWRDVIPEVKPASAGLLALPIIVPLALAQRQAYSVPSWLPDFSVDQLTGILGDFWMATVPFAAAVIIVVAILMLRRRGDATRLERVRLPFEDAGVVSLIALATTPVALASLSVVGQPSMLPRYGIGAALAWAPWVAVAATLGGRWIGRVMIIGIAWYWFVGYTKEVRLKHGYANALRATAGAYQQARIGGEGLPIVFSSIHVMYPLLTDARGADARALFLDVPDSTFDRLFPDSTRLGQANRIVVLERDLARVHRDRFGIPGLAPLDELARVDRFLLLAPEGRLPEGFRGVDHFAKAMFPRHQLRRLMADLSLLELPSRTP